MLYDSEANRNVYAAIRQARTFPTRESAVNLAAVVSQHSDSESGIDPAALAVAGEMLAGFVMTLGLAK